jgi:hypothetical protein
MFPSHLDGGFHIVSQDDELRWSTIVMGAKTYDINLSHSGRKIARKLGKSKGLGFALGAFFILRRPVICSPRDTPRNRAKDERHADCRKPDNGRLLSKPSPV